MVRAGQAKAGHSLVQGNIPIVSIACTKASQGGVDWVTRPKQNSQAACRGRGFHSQDRHRSVAGGRPPAAGQQDLRCRSRLKASQARLCRLNYQYQIYSYITPGKDTASHEQDSVGSGSWPGTPADSQPQSQLKLQRGKSLACHVKWCSPVTTAMFYDVNEGLRGADEIQTQDG